MYDAVDVMLSGECRVLSDSVDESGCRRGLSASNSSSVTGGVDASQGAEGVLSFSGMTLALGRGFRVDRCQRMSSMEGDTFAAGVGIKAWGRWAMQQEGFDEGPGSGVWCKCLDMG